MSIRGLRGSFWLLLNRFFLILFIFIFFLSIFFLLGGVNFGPGRGLCVFFFGVGGLNCV